MDLINKHIHDTHLHLDLLENKSKIISQININKSYTIAVTNLPQLYTKLKNEINSKYIRVALGFHPDLVNQYEKHIQQMWNLLKDAKYIGEVGLDPKNKSEIEFQNQISFFKELINRCNMFGNKILSIHSRGAEKEILSIIGTNFKGKIIFHWYSGTIEHIDEIIGNGFYFSINKAMLQSKKGKGIIKKIPIDRLLIESDAPFVKHYNYFMDLHTTINDLAVLKGIKPLEMNEILYYNFKRLLMN